MLFAFLGFGLAWDLTLFFSFLFLHRNGNVCPMSALPLYLQAHDLPDFTDSQLERNLAQDEVHFESHPYLI